MTRLKKYLFGLIAMIAATVAFPPAVHADNAAKRDAWFKEMQQLKHDYLVHELNITREQQTRFFPLYDKMEGEKRRIFEQTRALEKSISDKGDKATDLELEKATDALVEMKAREAAIEKSYYTRFKTVLTPSQLFNLNKAERKFQRKMVNEHHRKKNAGGKKK